jgi:hypothetical protein
MQESERPYFSSLFTYSDRKQALCDEGTREMVISHHLTEVVLRCTEAQENAGANPKLLGRAGPPL